MGTFNDKMTGLADAFRSKFSLTGGLTIDQMTTTVRNADIGDGGGFDFSAATAFTADQLLEGEKGFNSNGELITGTLTVSDTPVVAAPEYGYFTADGNFQQITLDADAPQNVGESVEIAEGSVFLYATGQDEPDYSIVTDATAADVAYGKTVVLNGMLVTGAMPTSSISVKDNVVSITSGKIAEREVTVGTALPAKTYTPCSEPIVIKAGQYLTGDQTIEAVEGESSGGGVTMYKCTAVDTGAAYPDYTNISLSGVTPAAMNVEYMQNDPMLVDFNRTWSAEGNSIGWDAKNSAWCIYNGNGTPNFVSSLFYSKIEGMSAEKGTASDPLFWDADGVVSGNRLLTVDFNSSEAAYDDEYYGQSWNVYARLKAGVEYTIGLVIPPDDEENGTYYEAYFYIYDFSGNQVASTYSRSEAVSIGGKDVTWYCKYTPAADGLFRFCFEGMYSTVITPFVCSPAPEVTTAPKTGIFEQGGNWKIGGGQNARLRVLSAGLSQCVGDFTQIEGNGAGIDSVWQNADGSVFVYAYKYSGDEYKWYMGSPNGNYNYYYRTATWHKDSPTHPAVAVWNDRNSSSYGDLPVVEILPTTTVSGTPVLTPVEKEGRDALGYSVWSGVKMAQVDGVWQETEARKDGMLSTAFTPTPGCIYSEDGSVKVQSAYKDETSVLCWGENNSTYGVLGIGDTKEKYTPIKSERVYTQITCYEYHALALDTDGHLWGWGRNNYGQIGDGTTTNRQTAVKVGNKVWKQVAVGEYHSVGLDEDGYLYVWGYNARGELGNGSSEGSQLSEPTKISDKKFNYIHAYYRCTFAIDEDGYMWGSGVNTNGELGNGTKTNITTLTKLNDKKWKSVWSAYSNRTYAIDTDGYLWGSGSNSNGQLGIGQSGSSIYEFTRCGDLRWKKVVGGHKHTIAINEEGFLYACGQGFGTDGFGNSVLTRLPGISRVKDCAATYEGSFYIDEYDRAFTFTASSTGYMLALPMIGAQTTYPVGILTEYRVDKLCCTIRATARFAIVRR